MRFNLSSGGYNIINSGQTFLFGPDMDLQINIVTDKNSEFIVILKFKTDTQDGYRIDTQIDKNTITLNCFNFKVSGTGLSKPVRIATIEGKEILLLFWSYLEGSDNGTVRSVKYTIFISNNSGEHQDGQ